VKPEFQLAFLSKLQRLFAEGDFTATYKFALLIALADLSVELGRDDNEPLNLPYRKIGLKFIQLYWQQAAPFTGGDVLVQNLGTQAAVVSSIAKYRRKHPSMTLNSAPSGKDFKTLLSSVTATVKLQPVQYIQNLGGGKDVFLFDAGKDGLTLLPGVAYCLRRFQTLVQQLARSHWVDHIRGNKRNLPLLGKDDDLESFLFETPRQALTTISTGLRKINEKCHYCGGTVKEADVDHFIPHSLYPRDLIHNFVLAHPSCNRSKSNTLAAKQHLVRWLEFIDVHHNEMSEIGSEAGINSDAPTTLSVARWGYSNALSSNGQAWVKSAQYEPLESSYLGLWA
jgi:5-methylcytosine-specific restriction endonuclease McrA